MSQCRRSVDRESGAICGGRNTAGFRVTAITDLLTEGVPLDESRPYGLVCHFVHAFFQRFGQRLVGLDAILRETRSASTDVDVSATIVISRIRRFAA
jgi:hypothetical protein